MIGWSGCKKDDGNSGNPSSTTEKVTTTVSGRVYDEQGNFVVGATVIAGGQTAVTNQWGIYLIENVDLIKDRALILVSKSGFWNQTGTCYPSKGVVTYRNLTLFSATTTQVIIAAIGGVVTLSSGTSVNFPANAFADANGNIYSGSVNICMHELASNDAKLGLKVPGSDFIAVDQSGKDGILKTYGMVGVVMKDQLGNTLKIASGKKANLTFPIAANQISSAPASIALWYFDDTIGKWKEEGSAIKTGNTYKADVSHFTWWNCDVWTPLAHAQGYVKDCSGVPLANIYVEAYGLNGGGTSYGQTDANGYYYGGIPSGENVDIYGSDFLNANSNFTDTQHEKVFALAGAIVTVPDLVLDSLNCGINIDGFIIDCNNSLTAATVLCFDNTNALVDYQVTTTGNFRFHVSAVGTYSILAYKGIRTGNASVNAAVLGQQYSTGNISLCDTLSTNNNLQLVFNSTLVGSIASSFQVSGCSVTGTAPNQAIVFTNYDSITGNTTNINLNIPTYANGTYVWNMTNSNITGTMISNGQTYSIAADPNGTGSTTISNACAIGGNINGSFSGDVILTNNGIPISGTLSSNFSIHRDN